MLITKTRTLIVLYLFLLSIFTSIAQSNEKHLTLVVAGNMPDIGVETGGTYTRLAGLLEKIRAEKTQNIFAFAGGSLGPSSLSSLDRGSHIIDILNTLEPDLMTLSKREFSYYEDELTLRSNEAAFPIVSSNLYDPLIKSNLEGILSSLLVEKNNTKVGFISILDEEVVEDYLLKRLKVFEPRQVIQQQVAMLKQQGAELVILIYSKERSYYRTLISENQIDFALRIWTANGSNKGQHQFDKVYSISYEQPFLLLDINWQTNNQQKNLVITAPKVSYPDALSESATSLLIDEYNQRLDRLLNQKIGVFNSEIQTLRNLVRTKEVAFGNFVADTVRDYAKTDIGLVNGGVIRGNKTYPKGSVITRRDIATELPFRSHLTILQVTGAELRNALENSVSKVELSNGRFLQVSGISFTYSIEKPVGQRVQMTYVNGKKLDLNQKYSVATSDYLANGGDGYDAFLNALHKDQGTQQSPLLSDVVIRKIQQQKLIQPRIESRIKRVSK